MCSTYLPTGFSENSFLTVNNLGVEKNGVIWKEHDSILHNASHFASVEDLKLQLADKWLASEDRYCKILAS